MKWKDRRISENVEDHRTNVRRPKGAQHAANVRQGRFEQTALGKNSSHLRNPEPIVAQEPTLQDSINSRAQTERMGYTGFDENAFMRLQDSYAPQQMEYDPNWVPPQEAAVQLPQEAPKPTPKPKKTAPKEKQVTPGKWTVKQN